MFSNIETKYTLIVKKNKNNDNNNNHNNKNKSTPRLHTSTKAKF